MAMNVTILLLHSTLVFLLSAKSYYAGEWQSAHATFYGDTDGSETTSGSCGYTHTISQGYGLQTAALSMALYNEGVICGACFEIKCIDSRQWCKPEYPSIFITATNSCPPNYALSSDNGGWCNPPRVHFDLSMPAYLHIAEYKAGIVPITYRRVPCAKKGGIRFTMNGNRYFNLVLVSNVAGAGDVVSVEVKSDKYSWTPMQRNWGQNWQISLNLTGQSVSFRVTASDKRISTSLHVAPRQWQFGQTYEGNNFRNINNSDIT